MGRMSEDERERKILKDMLDSLSTLDAEAIGRLLRTLCAFHGLPKSA